MFRRVISAIPVFRRGSFVLKDPLPRCVGAREFLAFFPGLAQANPIELR